MISEYINLRNDIIFKVVFGYERNEKILISLLNSILDLKDDDKIVKVTFLNTNNIKEYLSDKSTSLDIKASDENGKRYNIEMQVVSQEFYIKRIIYYHDKIYTEQLKSGEDYNTLNKSISISILNFVLLENEKNFHNIYRYLNIESNKELTDIKELHFIELPKFNKKDPDKLETKIDKWVYTIKNGEYYVNDIESIPNNLKKEEEIIMSISEMIKAGQEDLIRELIESREKGRRDELSRINSAERKGLQKGIEKGIQQGIQQGIEKGRLEGIQERQIELVKNMYKEGASINFIMKVANLSEEEIKKIISKLV